ILPAALSCLRSQKDKLQPVASIPRVNMWAVAICFAVLGIPLSWFSARGLLHSDESGYSFQARIYRSGHLMAEPLICVSSGVSRRTPAELAYTGHVLRPYGWFPKFPPGWPLVLTLGYLVSARWLLNPIFGVMQLAVIAALGSRCFARETASLWYYAGMFACLAATLQVRPYTGFVVTVVLTVAALWFNRRNQHVLVR